MAYATKVKFQAASAFQRDLKADVDAYFERTGLKRRDLPMMWLKTAIIFGWTAGWWTFLTFGATSLFGAAVGCVGVALGMAGVGFAIQHDANHGGYSENAVVNRVMAWSLDVVGGSSYVWKWKHNIFHHSHPNVVGLDADISLGPLGRLAPAQKLRAGHRFQQVYMWFLYGLLSFKWHFIDDYVDLVKGTVDAQKMPRPKARGLIALLGGKAVFYAWAVITPCFFHPVWQVALAYFVTSFVLGLTLATAFQLAHCVEEADFPALPTGGKFDVDFAAHQVATTVDFAPRNPLVTWYLGGLNFQAVHHLFPNICHLHYPALAKVVAATCAKHGIRYRSNDTFRAALMSHGRYLKKMGRPAPLQAQQQPLARAA